MTGKYLMREDGSVYEVPDLLTWAKAFEKSDPRIALDHVGAAKISTVFLGLDHGYDGVPVLFETMVFGGPHEYQERYTTRDEALRGHAKMVELVKSETET